MIFVLQNEREAAKSRVDRDQERIAQALEAAREVGDKEDEIKELALQVRALKVCYFLWLTAVETRNHFLSVAIDCQIEFVYDNDTWVKRASQRSTECR